MGTDFPLPAQHSGEGLVVRAKKDYDPMNPATWLVRLPTEFEWEKAARGTQGFVYPYGNEFDASKGNTSKTGLRQTSTVGMYPHGASPYGVLDMSGNVWEWCLTDYNNPQEQASDENMRSNSPRVLRGGSWLGNDFVARGAYRSNGNANDRSSRSIGFRLVSSPFS
jgi:formylglycine-generating enzyme required for sulfatase activity